MAETKVTRWYVLNAVTLGAEKYIVKVVGYDQRKGHTPPIVIPRGHLLDIPEGSCEALVDKFVRNKCMEKYDAKFHPDAFFGDQPVPKEEPEEEVEAARAPRKTSQATPITDETDDLPKVDEGKKGKPHEQARTIGGRKYS